MNDIVLCFIIIMILLKDYDVCKKAAVVAFSFLPFTVQSEVQESRWSMQLLLVIV